MQSCGRKTTTETASTETKGQHSIHKSLLTFAKRVPSYKYSRTDVCDATPVVTLARAYKGEKMSDSAPAGAQANISGPPRRPSRQQTLSLSSSEAKWQGPEAGGEDENKSQMMTTDWRTHDRKRRQAHAHATKDTWHSLNA